MKDTRYGFGKNPPYSLYQSPDGKWGLIDGSGNKLEAVFKRGDSNSDAFSCVPWEVVNFNPQEGFTLAAWYDPDEVWFSFTFNDTAYPSEYHHYLWEKSEFQFEEIYGKVKSLLQQENHWLIDGMELAEKEEKMDDEEFDQALKNILAVHPELTKPSNLNPILYPIMENENVDEDIKRIVWKTKIALDYTIKYFTGRQWIITRYISLNSQNTHGFTPLSPVYPPVCT